MSLARRVLALGVAGAALSAVWALCALPAGGQAPPAVPQALTPPPSTCPAGAYCTTIPSPCPPQQSCPTVVASPTTNLGFEQAVSLSFYGFGSNPTIYYCADAHPGSFPLTCVTGGLGFPNAPLPSSELVVVGPGGTAKAVFQVQPAIPGSDKPFTGWNPATDQNTGTTFFCDNGPDNCALDIVVPDGKAPNPANTATVPVSFLPAQSPCPPSAPQISTMTSYSTERIMPFVNLVNCQGAAPVVNSFVATGSAAVAQGVASGQAAVGFTDDPEDPATQQALSSSGHHFAFIPVALSATVVAFAAHMRANGLDVPLQSFNLTPNMVAGLVNYTYTNWTNADMVKAPFCPKKKPNGKNPPPCSLLVAVNPVPPQVQLPPIDYASYYLRQTSGSTSELTWWLCSAPNPPMTVAGTTYTEPTLAATTWTTTNGQVTQSQWPVQSCTTTDQFPSFPGSGSNSFFNSGISPLDTGYQAIHQVADPPVNAPVAAFSTMDWSEAAYLGLNAASLLNAAGKFVAPSPASVQAALADARANPDGTLTPSLASADPVAYPLPMVTYAVVETDPVPPEQAAATKSLLHNLLSITGGTNQGFLPSGYVPLPASLYSKAQAEVDADVKAAAPSGSPGGGGPAGPAPGSGPGEGAAGVGGIYAPGSASPLGESAGGLAGSPGSGASGASSAPSLLHSAAARRASSPLEGGRYGWVVPAALGLGGGLTLAGPAVLAGPEAWQRARGLRTRLRLRLRSRATGG
ncbi:MAG TPA: hypothetical protein VKY15_00590 [Acidimicrobiales bacterium]|nr:hypothetical protein [Acidimicrobiales bacterium]